MALCVPGVLVILSRQNPPFLLSLVIVVLFPVVPSVTSVMRLLFVMTFPVTLRLTFRALFAITVAPFAKLNVTILLFPTQGALPWEAGVLYAVTTRALAATAAIIFCSIVGTTASRNVLVTE